MVAVGSRTVRRQRDWRAMTPFKRRRESFPRLTASMRRRRSSSFIAFPSSRGRLFIAILRRPKCVCSRAILGWKAHVR